MVKRGKNLLGAFEKFDSLFLLNEKTNREKEVLA
jgi:hypothetical protein